VIKEWRAVNQRICVINKKEIKRNYDHSLLSRSNIEQQCSRLDILNRDNSTSQNEDNILPEIRFVK
jgi:hypothetical protein